MYALPLLFISSCLQKLSIRKTIQFLKYHPPSSFCHHPLPDLILTAFDMLSNCPFLFSLFTTPPGCRLPSLHPPLWSPLPVHCRSSSNIMLQTIPGKAIHFRAQVTLPVWMTANYISIPVCCLHFR